MTQRKGERLRELKSCQGERKEKCRVRGRARGGESIRGQTPSVKTSVLYSTGLSVGRGGRRRRFARKGLIGAARKQRERLVTVDVISQTTKKKEKKGSGKKEEKGMGEKRTQ